MRMGTRGCLQRKGGAKLRWKRELEFDVQKSIGAVPPRTFTGLPRVPHLPRPDAMQLFGCALFEARTARNLSIEVVAKGGGCTETWLKSVELGTCCPTGAGFERLALGLKSDEHPDIDPHRLFVNFEGEPFCKEALRLRAKFGLESPSLVNVVEPETSGLVPLLESMRYRDRLLTLSPLTLLLILVVLVLAGNPTAGNGYHLKVDTGILALGGVCAALFVSLVIPALSNVFERLAARTRVGFSATAYAGVEKLRKSYGAVGDVALGWYRPDEAVFVDEVHRDDLRQVCIDADLAERMVLVFGASSLLALTMTIVAAQVANSVPKVLPWATASVVLGGLAVVAIIVRNRNARDIVIRLRRGYGAAQSLDDVLAYVLGRYRGRTQQAWEKWLRRFLGRYTDDPIAARSAVVTAAGQPLATVAFQGAVNALRRSW
jgi:hypothetical protein